MKAKFRPVTAPFASPAPFCRASLVAGPAIRADERHDVDVPRSEQDFATRGRAEADDRGLPGGQPGHQGHGRAAGLRADAGEVLPRPPHRRESGHRLDRREEPRRPRAHRAPAPISTRSSPRNGRRPIATTTTPSPPGTRHCSASRAWRCRIFNGGSMIYYRKDLLAKAGIDPKSPDDVGRNP